MYRAIIHSLIVAFFSLLLISCGGGGSGGIGGTGITTNGTISGFGSIFVNGIEFETDNAIVSGDLGQVGDLRLGMVVTVRGKVNNDGLTGTADSIDVDIELQGPVETAPVLDTNNNTQTFTILGRTIVVTDGSTVFDDNGFSGFSFLTIAQDDIIEVSGYLDANAAIQATRIEKQGVVGTGNTSVEIEGEITDYVSNSDFRVNGVQIDASMASFEPSGLVLANGINIEVKGELTGSNEITASEIELHDEPFNDNDMSVEVEGYITDYISPASFRVNGIQIDASGATLTPSSLMLGNNIRVEVKGSLDNGVVTASRVEGRNSELRMQTTVAAIEPVSRQVTLDFAGQSIVLSIDNQTKLEDETSSNTLTLGGLAVGDFVEVRAYQDGTENIATDLTRLTNEPDGEVELRGPVTVGGTTGQETLTIAGVTYSSDGNTEFEVSEVPTARTDFFNTLNDGDIVEIKDFRINSVIDGVADEMDLKS